MGVNGINGESIADLLADLFGAIEQREWGAVRRLLDDEVHVDHTSIGGVPLDLTADELVHRWRVTLHAKKASFHLLSRCRVTVCGDDATARLNCYACNVLADELGGGRWEVWGTHVITLRRRDAGWKARGFVFTKVHARGDERVYTHVLEAGDAL